MANRKKETNNNQSDIELVNKKDTKDNSITDKVKNIAENTVESVKDISKNSIHSAEEVAANALGSAKDSSKEAIHTVEEVAAETLDSAKEIGEKAIDATKDGVDKAANIGHDAAEVAGEFASKAKETASNFFTTAPAVIIGMFKSIKETTPPVHPAGYPFVFLFFVASVLLAMFSTALGWIGFICTAWCLYFFRNPKRTVPQGDKLIVSPADGRVQMIVDVIPPAELELGNEELTRVSIFLNVFDVHVQRSPVVGEVVAEHYHEGLFLNASLDKASEDNERQLVTVQMNGGEKVGFVQIAGLIARRIICNLKVGQKVDIGDLYGLIRFGSRVDVFLPKGIKPLVHIGQRAVGGETIIADLEAPNIERTAIEKE